MLFATGLPNRSNSKKSVRPDISDNMPPFIHMRRQHHPVSRPPAVECGNEIAVVVTVSSSASGCKPVTAEADNVLFKSATPISR